MRTCLEFRRVLFRSPRAGRSRCPSTTSASRSTTPSSTATASTSTTSTGTCRSSPARPADGSRAPQLRQRARRLAVAALALLACALATLSVSAALRDVDPPRLYYEAPTRVPEGAEVELFVSADEPVTYVVAYAGDELSAVAQDHVFVLTAAPGVNEVVVTATDAAGNASVARLTVEGVPPVDVTVEAARELRAGDPLGVTVAVAGNGARVTSVTATFGGEELPLLRDGAVHRGVAATPFGVEPAVRELVVTV